MMWGGPSPGQECAGALTGTRGEALTLSRASSGMCTKGDGTMVLLGNNVPRVQPGGLLMEAARTNLVVRSQEFDTAIWVKANATVAAPVVTANYATAPDGTITAERVQFAATPSAGNGSWLEQGFTASAAMHSASCYMRATTGSATTNLTLVIAGTAHTTTITLGETWQRVTLVNKALTAVTWNLVVGSDRRVSPGATHTTTAAADILLWGCQVEAGVHASSYIATTAATVTRSADAATVANPLTSANTTWCLAATINGNSWPKAGGNGILSIGTVGAANSTPIYLNSSDAFISFYVQDNAAAYRVIQNAAAPSLGRHRFRGCNQGGVLSFTMDGVS